MLFDLRMPREPFVAHVALKGLLLRVDGHVRDDVGLVGELLGADGAAERLLSRVHPHVVDERVAQAEARVAHGAGEGLLPGVHAQVCGEVGALGDFLAAERARFLPRVALHVALQVVLASEAFAALRAAVRFLG